MAVTKGRKAIRWTAAVLGVLGLAVVGTGLWLRGRVAASLPQLDGQLRAPAISEPVTIERDSLGVPTVRGSTRVDVAFGLGFLHGQERFFQMDLMRRRAAGELAELFGAAAVPADRAVRRHRFTRIAEQIIARAPATEAALIDAYTAGVNAGLAALDERPFEYLLLRAEPRAWRTIDTPLVVLSMYLVLQDDDGSSERSLQVMYDTLPPEMVAFLVPPGTEWDAPVEGETFATPAVPGPGVFDLRAASSATAEAGQAALPEVLAAGSNNWVVAGSRTADGVALLANDPHLPLGVPNIWYRASLMWPDEAGAVQRVVGVTLPGTPVMTLGSNGSVAWGFTNSQGDWGDVVVLEDVPGDTEAYPTPDGVRHIEHHSETIHVKGGDDVTEDVPWTVWGPLLNPDPSGRRLAFSWVAYSPEATGLGLSGLETATTVEECLEVANRGGIPAQNIVCAASDGRIGWTLTSLIPRRVGLTGSLPTSWADGSRGWQGWLEPAEMPRIVDPPGGMIWTANARVVSDRALQLIGDGGFDLGARAKQIRDGLVELSGATETDMLAIQLDDRALFLARWRDLLLEILTPATMDGAPQRREVQRLVSESWDGRASVDSVGYLLTREFRRETARRVFGPLTATCADAWEEFSYFDVTNQYEGPLWRLVTERPTHLLDPGFETWDALLVAAVDTVAERLTKDGTPLAERTWGARNTTRIRHPISRGVPWLSSWLDMPATSLPGDSYMPRVQSPTFAASERTVVAPGHEDRGLFHMPCGQAGHPLSPFYRAGHEAWEQGAPTPFLPGPTEHTLTLVPAAATVGRR